MYIAYLDSATTCHNFARVVYPVTKRKARVVADVEDPPHDNTGLIGKGRREAVEIGMEKQIMVLEEAQAMDP